MALNTTATSNQITVGGITCAASISITGGTYSINGGAYTNATGTVSNGNTVTVRQTSSGSYSTKTDAVLTIGGVSDTFSVTTVTEAIFIGDINGNGKIDLADAIVALKSLSGLNPPGIRSDYGSSGIDVNNDDKIGLEEALYILQLVAGLRAEAPATPAGFTVTATSSSQIDLAWTAMTGAIGYKIYKYGVSP